MRVWDIERGAYGVKNGCMNLQTTYCWVHGWRKRLGSELE